MAQAKAKAQGSPVLDPDVDVAIGDEKGRGPKGPRIRCPLCGWTPRQEDRWLLQVRPHLEYFR